VVRGASENKRLDAPQRRQQLWERWADSAEDPQSDSQWHSKRQSATKRQRGSAPPSANILGPNTSGATGTYWSLTANHPSHWQ